MTKKVLSVPNLRIRLFGNFSIQYDNRVVKSLNSPRISSLLAYLVMHRDVPQSRQHLAFLFWPDVAEAQARNNLRQLLHQLRHAVPEPIQFLAIATHQLQWQPTPLCDLDVAEFEEALSLADAASRQQDHHALQSALEQADKLYQGELFPDCYDEWIVAERERFHQLHLQVVERLLSHCEEQGDVRAALHHAQRLIELDRLSEGRYRHLMRLFMQLHDRSSALRVYHSCVTTLQRELGIEPEPATRAAYERLMQPEALADSSPVRQPLHLATPTLIGRKHEWSQLHDAWQAALAGEPHFALLTGEAGVGKSRLAEEFQLSVSQRGIVTAKTRAYAAEGQLSLAPVTEWLRSIGLSALLLHLEEVWLSEVARILPEIFTERPALPHPTPVTEYGQRQRFFEALARAMLHHSQPLLLVIDDLQWCDQETLEWLHFLLRFDPRARLLIIGCAREEDMLPAHPLSLFLLHLHAKMPVTQVVIRPLDAAETAKLASQVARNDLAVDAAMHLYRETMGYPLFVVEMMRSGLGRTIGSMPESTGNSQHFDAQTLPPRVHAVLAGRLQQLSAAAHAFVESAAIIGRPFTLDLLINAGTGDAESAMLALDELWHRRILREHGANSYDFIHDKLREVAYAEISTPHRQMLHRRVAQALETLHTGDLDAVSGQIASHYERAGMIEQALPHYQRAAAVAQHIYANEDAINLLSRGLELLALLPRGAKRDKQELRLLLALAPIYRITKGWTAPDLQRVLDRALALCDIVGDSTQRAQTLYGLGSVYVVQAKLESVQSVSDELQRLYMHTLGTPPPPFAGLMLTGSLMHIGKIAEANAQFSAIIAGYDPEQLLHFQESQGTNYAALAQAWQSHALWCLGYPQQALQNGCDAIKFVQDLDQPFNQALVSTYFAMLQQLRADESVAHQHAEEALMLGDTFQALYYRVWADILVRYAEASAQPDERHIRQLRDAITAFKESSARLRLPYYLSLLGRVYLKAGRFEDGLACMNEALAAARTHNERWWDAELHRLRGELLLLVSADPTDGEAAILRAIEIAQGQQAKSLELRATMSLARWWHTHDRTDEARQRLSVIYGWFTEGHDTPDLLAASAYLAQL